jgi:hypothetical protein
MSLSVPPPPHSELWAQKVKIVNTFRAEEIIFATCTKDYYYCCYMYCKLLLLHISEFIIFTVISTTVCSYLYMFVLSLYCYIYYRLTIIKYTGLCFWYYYCYRYRKLLLLLHVVEIVIKFCLSTKGYYYC